MAAATPPFEAQTLGGEVFVGPIVSLDAGRITIGTAEGPVSLPTDDLMTVCLKAEPTPASPEPDVWVRLVDGSLLAAQQITVEGGRARITLDDGPIVELSTAGIAAVRLQGQSEVVAAEWSRILDMKIDADLLVVRRGEIVDYHKGVLHNVTDALVQFELDGDVLPVSRSKVHGLVYYHPAGEALPETLCRITEAGGSQWSVHRLALPGELQWTTRGGLTVSRPLAMITRMDFSGGKVVYLSDLKPESVRFTPYFGTERDVPVLGEFRAVRMDVNLGSDPLQLGEKQYGKGLALHSRTRIVYRLPERFRRFKAVVGIDDGVRPHGHVRLVIHGDEKLLLDIALSGTDPPKPVDLDLGGVRRLAILIDFGDGLDVADHLDLCSARIIK
ncbi:MAG: hypothetical protein A2V70_08965 [Planctomycetes bacterium RBG_13_63_9]|nr:MAG: hypothetical protein A2V70_08965 [Planctomycetes bacterium RBG_13_63_9]